MLRNQNIICISSIDWDFVWQGHQEIMSTFAKNGNRVLFIENTGIRRPTLKDIPRLRKRIINWIKGVKGFRKGMENLYIYSPIILPFQYALFARWVNKYMLLKPLKRWNQATDFHNPVIWTFLPTGTALDIINNIEKKLLVYYCIADLCKLVKNPKKLKGTEEALIKKSDVIFAQGDVLAEKCRQFNNNVHIFPFGVNVEAFDNFKFDTSNIPEDIKGIKRPIIGYVGGVHRHIDFELLAFIAKTHPEWSMVLIGPIQTDISGIRGLGNIFLLGQKEFIDLPKYINEFSAGIIPYKLSEYTQTVIPTKMNEYHAMGKPVVSTELPEIVVFNKKNDGLVLVGKNYNEFADCVVRAIHDSDARLIQKRISSAKINSWATRIEEMAGHMEEAIDRKSIMPLDWRESFLKLYTKTRRSILNTAFILLSAYLLVFYTPVVWFFASPLKISQAPQKTDAILVFAAGVGESGKPGQGYEERVGYATELYNKGYAKHMIFSSGYTYAFKEPLMMKALAVSLGVPDEAIVLEDKAGNTFENVKFSKEILDKNKWHKIILVSSPYHMLRASLVLNKVAPDITVVYSPIPQSRYYGRVVSTKWRVIKQIDLKQIRGILHEYLGIIYYWFKGYI